MDPVDYNKDSIFRIGEVYAVNGREIVIRVDQNKNLPHIIYKGELIKNVSVGSFLKIKKGFYKLVAKVESETLKENRLDDDYHSRHDILVRLLSVKIIGYFANGSYHKGVKEIPLIGNTAYLMDNTEFERVHRFASSNEITIQIGNLMADENVPIRISIDRLFASHIGIFGNTGSGKSHTLAKLYKELFEQMGCYKNFYKNSRFVVFDFNGEYSEPNTLCCNKTIYNLKDNGNTNPKIPFLIDDLLRVDTLSILSDATEKTQQPFIKRALKLYRHIKNHDSYDEVISHLKNTISRYIKDTLLLKDGQKERTILDVLDQILLSGLPESSQEESVLDDIEIYGNGSIRYILSEETFVNSKNYDSIFPLLKMCSMLNGFTLPDNPIKQFLIFLNLRLIIDIVQSKAQNDHIHPVVRRLDSLMNEIPNIFELGDNQDIFKDTNIVVVNLNELKTDLKKLIPLIISMALYRVHKKDNKRGNRYLNLIIDEAHNILSTESKRETESWKDYRLETFEEIIKEGRKFGVFLTLSSQRPSDISATIVSQLHNYFIHRLVNNKDIEMIEKAVSYLDNLSIESLPILPVGACVLSGLIADLPTVIQIDELSEDQQPKSQTIKLTASWIDSIDEEGKFDASVDDFDEDEYIDDAEKEDWYEEL